VAASQKGVTIKICCWMTKPRMLHNVTACFGLKWILWNDVSNGKRELNLETQKTELAKNKPEFVVVQ
jgi:hypothetical protein